VQVIEFGGSLALFEVRSSGRGVIRVKKIYVGNLSWGTTDRDLEQLFAAHGEVRSATVITDRDTGRSRGFGFVEMDDTAAADAISALNDKEFDGRRLKVNEARDRPRERGPRSGGGGGGGRW
jgi:cold-inducible RNA-binding protein